MDYMLLESNSGKYILVVHGNEDGELLINSNILKSTNPDYIVCCFPELVKRKHPHLPILMKDHCDRVYGNFETHRNGKVEFAIQNQKYKITLWE